MKVRFVLAAALSSVLDEHFRAAMPREQGAFLLLQAATDGLTSRLFAKTAILPDSGAWEDQGEDHLSPSGRWLSSVVGRAVEADAGIAFVHSHPDPAFPASLSPIDMKTSAAWSRTLTPLLGQPLASLVWSPQGMAGSAYFPDNPGQTIAIDKIDIVGRGRAFTVHGLDLARPMAELDDRQVRALGLLGNDRLRSLVVGIVGAGGTGSVLADLLARMGVLRLILIDDDLVDTPSNLRRVVGSSLEDLAATRPKVDVVGAHVEDLGLGTDVVRVFGDIRSPGIAEHLLDADVVIGTTDTHGSRAFMNQFALEFGIPFLDVGLRIGTTTSGDVSGMPVEIRLVLPDTSCLWCRGVLNAERIRAENLPEEERSRLTAEGYVQSLAQPVPSIAALNFFAASAAALAMLKVCAGVGESSSGLIIDGYEGYVQTLDSPVVPGCVCHEWR